MAQGIQDDVVETALREAVVPLLESIERELGQAITTDVVVIREGIRDPAIRVGREDAAKNSVDGELRLSIREAALPNRYLYSMESVYRRDLSPTGFSGFTARGAITWKPKEKPALSRRSFTTRYNVWHFKN